MGQTASGGKSTLTLTLFLARLYGVTVGRLNEAVRRNRDRFPPDFMFPLTKDELESLRAKGPPPYAFTEHGVAMLSSVLRGKRAIHVNIEIMRAFVRLRRRGRIGIHPGRVAE